MHYVGMDCHITTLEFAVVNEAGRLVKANRVPTSVNGFMEFVKTVPLPRTIYMEEGTLAAWALENSEVNCRLRVNFGYRLCYTLARSPRK